MAIVALDELVAAGCGNECVKPPIALVHIIRSTRRFQALESNPAPPLSRQAEHPFDVVLPRAGVTIVGGSRADAADPSGVLILEDGTRLGADLVIAADGMRSTVAQALDIPITRVSHQDGIRIWAEEPCAGKGDVATAAQELWLRLFDSKLVSLLAQSDDPS
jgi:2-polyprenyl-6-methoxyphenol hydroxylase-like FAD-dependent oxidoreductase